ncbi:MAG: hypothetical protein U9O55_02640 [Patescibacteria group bacterium]|nr:hypothetical protein [Patescibacteria group bacterium]
MKKQKKFSMSNPISAILIVLSKKEEMKILTNLSGNICQKKTNLDNINDKDIYKIQELLNNMPRKILNYKTPNEIIAEFMF